MSMKNILMKKMNILALKSIKSNGNKNIIFNFISNLALRYNKIIFDDFNYPKKNFINLNSKSLSVPIN